MAQKSLGTGSKPALGFLHRRPLEGSVCIHGETPYDGADQTRFITQFLLASVAVTTWV